MNRLHLGVLVAATLIGSALFAQNNIPPGSPQGPVPNALTPNTPATSFNSLMGTLRVKASPDECFSQLKKNRAYDWVPANGCASVGKAPKTNAAYVWGQAWDGNRYFYFGTTANGQCVTQGGLSTDPASLNPYQTSTWACEFATGPYSPLNEGPFAVPGVGDPAVPTKLPGQIGDIRPPRMYEYDRVNRTIIDITPRSVNPPSNVTRPGGAPPLYNPSGLESTTLNMRGYRAAVLVNGPAAATDPADVNRYLIVAAPAFTNPLSITFQAFDRKVRRWIAKRALFTPASGSVPASAPYDSIRRMFVYNNVVYAPVGRTNNTGGAVLRLTFNFTTLPAPPAPTSNSNIPICATCFGVTEVATFDGEGAYATVHENRIYVSTWPAPGNAGVYMSPDIPVGGLTNANLNQWTKIFSMDGYDPDPAVARSIAGGAIQSWNGSIYFGQQIVPYAAVSGFQQAYFPGGLPENLQFTRQILLNTFRAIAIFRIDNLPTPAAPGNVPSVRLLYGNTQLPKYVPNADPLLPGTWELTNNGLNQTPQFGPAGFGNPYNNYTWSMGVWNNRLYIGTMDWGFLAAEGAKLAGISLTNLIPTKEFGGDLWVFTNPNNAAVPESVQGVGNDRNYGIRNIVPVSNSIMLLGTANAVNLDPKGGFEVIEVTPRGGGIVR